MEKLDTYEYGRPLLARKLQGVRPGLVIFSFKKVAERVFVPFSGDGFVSGLRIGRADVFIMPEPYEKGRMFRPASQSWRIGRRRTSR